MVEIALNRGYVAIVDAADYEWLSQWKWSASQNEWGCYAKRAEMVNGKMQTVSMHRLIMGVVDDGSHDVDHIDRNGLNNRRSNLRLATRSQNMANMGRPKRNTSGFKGVGWHRERSKWQAYIRVHGKLIHLGRFAEKEQAAEAYAVAASKHFGEFARLA